MIEVFGAHAGWPIIRGTTLLTTNEITGLVGHILGMIPYSYGLYFITDSKLPYKYISNHLPMLSTPCYSKAHCPCPFLQGFSDSLTLLINWSSFWYCRHQACTSFALSESFSRFNDFSRRSCSTIFRSFSASPLIVVGLGRRGLTNFYCVPVIIRNVLLFFLLWSAPVSFHWLNWYPALIR